MNKSEYSQKLRDPKWQKKRLEIMQRDNFTCRKCGSKDKTLHVHHVEYHNGNDPWEYPDNYYLTLCFECHEEEGDNYSKGVIANLSDIGFLQEDFFKLDVHIIKHRRYYENLLSALRKTEFDEIEKMKT